VHCTATSRYWVRLAAIDLELIKPTAFVEVLCWPSRQLCYRFCESGIGIEYIYIYMCVCVCVSYYCLHRGRSNLFGVDTWMSGLMINTAAISVNILVAIDTFNALTFLTELRHHRQSIFSPSPWNTCTYLPIYLYTCMQWVIHIDQYINAIFNSNFSVLWVSPLPALSLSLSLSCILPEAMTASLQV